MNESWLGNSKAKVKN